MLLLRKRALPTSGPCLSKERPVEVWGPDEAVIVDWSRCEIEMASKEATLADASCTYSMTDLVSVQADGERAHPYSRQNSNIGTTSIKS